MSTLTILTGMVFGRLTVVEYASVVAGHHAYKTLCTCGTSKVVRASSLLSGTTKSCGCLHAAGSKPKHGWAATPEYKVWGAMKARCTNPKNPQYKDYGGRGITVCPEWAKFENFIADMGKRPDGMTLERADNNMGYGPDNCVWAPMIENCNNRRTSKFVVYCGERHTLAEWARIAGVTRGTMTFRMKMGWPLSRAFAPKGAETVNV